MMAEQPKATGGEHVIRTKARLVPRPGPPGSLAIFTAIRRA